jgi:hypothetical protein
MKAAAAATILFILTTAAFAFGAQTQTDWIKYDSPEGRYSILFPGKPELSTQEGPAQSGQKLTQHMAIYADPDPATDVAYIAAYFDLAPGMAYSFDEGRDGLVKAVNGTLQSEKPIQLGAYAGREIRATANRPGKDFVLIVRLFLVEKRVYMNQFIFAKPYDAARAEQKAAKFLDSFALKNSR